MYYIYSNNQISVVIWESALAQYGNPVTNIQYDSQQNVSHSLKDPEKLLFNTEVVILLICMRVCVRFAAVNAIISSNGILN